MDATRTSGDITVTEDKLKSFLEHIDKLAPLYSRFHVALLAVKKEDMWILLQALVVLTPELDLKPPKAVYPEERFLILHQARPISEFRGFLKDLEEGRLLVNDKTVSFPRESGDRFDWHLFDPDKASWPMSGFSGIGIRIGDATLTGVLDSLDFDHQLMLRTYYKQQYSDISELMEKAVGVRMETNQFITVELYAPSWCRIEKAALGKGAVRLQYVCPSTILDDLRLDYSFKVEGSELHFGSSTKQIARPDKPPEPIGTDKTLVRCVQVHLEEDPDDDLYRLDEAFIGKLESSVILHHVSRILMAKSCFVIEGTSENPNGVSFAHFERALALAKECQAEDDRQHPKVGAVLVKDGHDFIGAFRGEMGRGDHAEYIALERKGRNDPRVEGADLITTLEPCTERSHDKRPCVSWIKSRRIRKVWIATLDYNPTIAGNGELALQKEGILIGRFPDHLAKEVLRINESYLKEIEAKQPQLSVQEQKDERDLVLGIIREQLDLTSNRLNNVMSVRTQYLALSVGHDVGEELDETEQKISDAQNESVNLQAALQHALLIEVNDILTWMKLGDVLFEGGQTGLAGHVYAVVTKIDATVPAGWDGIAKVELVMYKGSEYWPAVNRYYSTDFSPNELRSTAWLEIARNETDIPTRIKALARAVQLGNRTEEAKEMTMKIFHEAFTTPDSEEGRGKRTDLSHAYDALADAWDFAEQIELATICYAKGDLVIHDSVKDAVEYALFPWNVAWTLHVHLSNLLDEEVSNAIEASVDTVVHYIELWRYPERLAPLFRDVEEYRSSPKIREAFRKREIEID